MNSKCRRGSRRDRISNTCKAPCQNVKNEEKYRKEPIRSQCEKLKECREETNHLDKKSYPPGNRSAYCVSKTKNLKVDSKSSRSTDQQSCNYKEMYSCSQEEKKNELIKTRNQSDAESYRPKRDNRRKNESYYASYSYDEPSSIRDLILGDDTPSPRGLTRDREAIKKSMKRSTISNQKRFDLKSEKENRITTSQGIDTKASKDATINLHLEMMKIETRRTILREGGLHFEETCVIQFPKNLPPNVRVITAPFFTENQKF